MGNLTDSASGSSTDAQGKQAGMSAGMGQVLQGAQAQQGQNEQLINTLAQMGPPPGSATQASTTAAGEEVAGKYQSALKPPSVNYKSRLNSQLDPSVGALLTGGA